MSRRGGMDLENTYSIPVTVNLMPSQHKRLEAIASAKGKSKMQIIRDALVQYLEDPSAKFKD